MHLRPGARAQNLPCCVVDRGLLPRPAVQYVQCPPPSGGDTSWQGALDAGTAAQPTLSREGGVKRVRRENLWTIEDTLGVPGSGAVQI